MSEQAPAEVVATPTVAQAIAPRRRLRRRLILVALASVVGFAVWYFAIREPEPRNDFERFQGDWKLTNSRQNSSDASDADEAEVRSAVQIIGDRWQHLPGGKAFRITLNESANPKEIDLELLDVTGLKGGAVKMRGVYTFSDNKTVRVGVKDATQPRPKSLDDADATDWVLTKVKLPRTPDRK